jgi:hypothetical protein
MSKVTVPLSIFDRSRMSLIRPSRSAPAAVDVLGELDLLVAQIALRVLAEHLREDQQRVQRRAQLVAHIGQEFGLVLRGQGQLFGLFLQRRLGLFDLGVLGFHLLVLGRQQHGLVFQFGVGGLQFVLLGAQQLLGLTERGGLQFQAVVGLLQLFLLGLELGGQQLRLLQQALGPHVGADGREHDADGFHQLVQERLLGLVELAEAGQFDHRLQLAFEQGGQDDDAARGALAQPRADLDVVLGDVGQQDAFLLGRALADQALAQRSWPAGGLRRLPA